MASEKKVLGDFGESKAVEFLVSKGYRIVKRNYSCRLGEIDIIARKDSFIVFAEVKLRKSDYYGSAAEFVTASKQSRIIKTARFWLASHYDDLQPRFDVIEVYAPDGENGPVKINHIEDAFWQ